MKIYLDNSSTTKPKKEVIDVIVTYLENKWHNPSSIYSDGMNVKKDIENSKKIIGDFINSDIEEIYFTSGATESNNWAIRGWDDANCQNDSIIITTPIEHTSIMYAVNNPALHSKVYFCDVDSYGLVDTNSLESILEENKNKKILVSVIHGNNEIGTVQHIKVISDLVHKYGGVLHSDCTQSFGKIPINIKELGVDMLSASAHKIHGIKGCGILYKNKNVNIMPLIYGSQQNKNRGGTENVAGIIGFAKAIELCDLDIDKLEYSHILRFAIINELEEKFGCKLNGHDTYRLPNNINVTFPQNITGESLLYTLDLSDIAISVGSACNSSSIEPSHVLKAIGLSDEEAMRTIRITLPDINDYTADEYNKMIDEFIKELEKAIKITES